jgi:hypothetical protein
VRLANALLTTEDIDIAKFHGISISIDEKMPDLEAVLKTVDPIFAPAFSPDELSLVGGFKNGAGFKVEFITPNRGDDLYSTRLAAMPSLGPSVGAQVLRYLDFLIRDPIRSVVLHDDGIPVLVPAPERYAIHKLIVATMRSAQSQAKARKDLDQTAALIDAFGGVRRQSDLGLAWIEAWERGRRWRRRVAVGALRLPDRSFEILATGLREAAKLERKNAADYGLAGGRDELEAQIAISRPTPATSGPSRR